MNTVLVNSGGPGSSITLDPEIVSMRDRYLKALEGKPFDESVSFSLEHNGSGVSPFSVESNGSILVAGSLDYEQNASHLIRIRGTEGNQSLVRGFEIKILDVFEMDINTASLFEENLECKFGWNLEH